MLVFCLRLAHHLGKSLAEIEALSWSEIRLWMAYDQQSPIGPERHDCNAALVAMTMAEINRDNRKRTQPFKLVDFLLFARKEKPAQTEDQIKQLLKSIVKTMGGK